MRSIEAIPVPQKNLIHQAMCAQLHQRRARTNNEEEVGE